MPNRTGLTGNELFIVDNSAPDWKVMKYLHDWCRTSKNQPLFKMSETGCP